MNIAPNGFKYHYPNALFEDVSDVQNWYINFDEMKVYIDGTKQVYDIFISKEDIQVGDDFYTKDIESLTLIIEAYGHYVLEKEIFEEN